jgi:hypothetical protein
VIQKRNFLYESESTYESTLGWIKRTDPPPQKPTMRDLPAFGPTHVAGPINPNTGNKALFRIRGCNVQRRRTKRGALKTEERGRILFSKKKKKTKRKGKKGSIARRTKQQGREDQHQPKALCSAAAHCSVNSTPMLVQARSGFLSFFLFFLKNGGQACWW